MSLIDELFSIEREAGKDSIVHALDARIKLIFCLCGLLVAVFVPYSLHDGNMIPWNMWISLIVIYLLCLMLYFLSKASIKYYLTRLCLILPFGIFVVIFQPFFFNPYYDVYHIFFTIGPLSVYCESLLFALSLLAKLIISVSFIILLSATTSSQDLVNGAARMHIPVIFITALTLTIRYLYVFAEMFQKIILAYSCRGFLRGGRGLPLKYRLQTIGNGAGTVFVRSLEQGERTYTAMCCRGYVQDESAIYFAPKPINRFEWMFLIMTLGYLILFPILIYYMF